MAMGHPIPAERRNSLVAALSGGALAVVGVVGITISGAHAAMGQTGGQILGFQVNLLHSAVHVLMGAGLIAAAILGGPAARVANAVAGLLLLVLGLGGMFVTGDNPVNLIALNGPDNAAHALGGAFLVAVGFYPLSIRRMN